MRRCADFSAIMLTRLVVITRSPYVSPITLVFY